MTQDFTPGLHRLAQMARHQKTFMASLIALYQEQEEMDDAGLAAFLQAEVEALTLVALCRRPRLDNDRFHADVKQIATYAKVGGVPNLDVMVLYPQSEFVTIDE